MAVALSDATNQSLERASVFTIDAGYGRFFARGGAHRLQFGNAVTAGGWTNFSKYPLAETDIGGGTMSTSTRVWPPNLGFNFTLRDT